MKRTRFEPAGPQQTDEILRPTEIPTSFNEWATPGEMTCYTCGVTANDKWNNPSGNDNKENEIFFFCFIAFVVAIKRKHVIVSGSSSL